MCVERCRFLATHSPLCTPSHEACLLLLTAATTTATTTAATAVATAATAVATAAATTS
jgi:hypothetical protein